MLTLTINGRPVQATAGQTVLEAASAAEITIPTLCHHRHLAPIGSCRLCVVEVESTGHQEAACTLAVTDGMIVRTESEELTESRRMILEMLAGHYVPSTHPNLGKTNELEHWADHYGVQLTAEGDDNASRTARFQVDSDPHPFIRVDLNQCILCTRCVRACDEIQGRFVWGIGYRGGNAKLIAGLDTTMMDARCESCGACADYCPTGALVDRVSLQLPPPETKTRTTCSYCGVGCQFDLNVSDNRIVAVSSAQDAPVNGASLCVKGRYGWDYVHHEDRLTSPLVRRFLVEGRTRRPGQDRGDWVKVSWETAFTLAATRIVEAKREHGPQAVGVLSSAKCTNEENYLMQKFARQVVGTHNIDHCARLCHSSTVAGLAMAFGSGAMSNSMADIANASQAIFIIGSNTTEQHPVFGSMIRQAVLRRGTKLVVADPRKIDIAEFAQLHIQHKPGTDVALLNGIMHIIVADQRHDQDFMAARCEGQEEFLESLTVYTPESVSRTTNVPEDVLREAASILSENRPMATIWAMGITQHTTGVINVLALANLQMLLGNMGLPGGGVNPLRGQNNVQGACDMGALPNVFPGYQSVTSDEVSGKFESAWQTACDSRREADVATLQLADRAVPGLTVTEMVEAAGRRDIRALYILGEDPAMTEPDCNRAKKCLADAEFVILQEIFPSETASFADILLPGCSFAEKDGTYTNTERRIQLVRQALPPMAAARPDWAITCGLARRTLELEGRSPVGKYAAWDYPAPESIMDEIAALTPSYHGVDHARLRQGDVLQWPVVDNNHAGTPILHVGQFTRGKGKFHAVDHLAAEELPDEEYPFLLTTGRVLYHWHGGELSRRSRGLIDAYPETLVEINPGDAYRLQIAHEAPVLLTSRRGEMTGKAMVTDRVSPGIVFGTFHFPDRDNVNNLTIAALDPVAKIPEYKVCAIRIERTHN